MEDPKPPMRDLEDDKQTATVNSSTTMMTIDVDEDIERNKIGEEVVRIDEVYGKISEGAPNYVNVGWMGSSVLMVKSQIGLGVLSIPSVLQTLGAVPGVLCILAIAIMTGWTGYTIGGFKQRHKTVHSVADVGFLLAGPIGREVFGAVYWLYMTLIAGSGLLGISIALNAVSTHGTCTVVFVVVGAGITAAFSSIQTLDRLSWIGWVGVLSIMAAIITLAVATGVTRPSLAPLTGPIFKDLHVIGNPTFADAMNALATVIFSFGGTPAFFTIIAEMKDTKSYTKSMITCQVFVTSTYIIIGIVVYYYAGQYVASPALGTAGPLLKKISYGIAIPSLIVAATIYTHLPAKYLLVRFLRGSTHLASNSVTHWVVWLSCVLACISFSFIIAEAVPVFNGLLGLIGALFGTFLAIIMYGWMWLYDNQNHPNKKSWEYILTWTWSWFIIIGGAFLLVGGTYGSILAIIAGAQTGSFSCADNSNS